MDGMRNVSKKNKKLKTFEIRIDGKLESRWKAMFKGLTLSIEDDRYTCLTVPVSDQAELFGVLRKMHDLGMTLLSVNPGKQEMDEANGKTK